MEINPDSNSADTRSILEELEACFVPGRPSNDLGWKAFLDCVRRNKEEVLAGKNFQQFRCLLERCLVQFDCDDLSLTRKMIDLWQSFRWYCHRLAIERAIFDSAKRFRKEVEKLNSQFFKKIELMVDAKYHVTEPIDVFYVVSRRDVNMMRVLVRSGLSCESKESCSKELFRDYGYLILDFLAFVRVFSPDGDITDNETLQTSQLSLSTRRTLLVLLVAHGLRENRLDKDELRDYVECVRLLFGCLPEPFVSVRELEYFLNSVFRNPKDEPVVRKIIGELRIIFPQISENMQPRSLLDLCRVRIRTESVKSGHTVSHAVTKLEIPRCLKKFIATGSVMNVVF